MANKEFQQILIIACPKRWPSVSVLSMYKFMQTILHKKGESNHVSKSNISLPEWLAVTRTSAPRDMSINLVVVMRDNQHFSHYGKLHENVQMFNASTLQYWLEDTVCKLNEKSPYRSLFSDMYVNSTSVQLRLTF